MLQPHDSYSSTCQANTLLERFRQIVEPSRRELTSDLSLTNQHSDIQHVEATLRTPHVMATQGDNAKRCEISRHTLTLVYNSHTNRTRRPSIQDLLQKFPW